MVKGKEDLRCRHEIGLLSMQVQCPGPHLNFCKKWFYPYQLIGRHGRHDVLLYCLTRNQSSSIHKTGRVAFTRSLEGTQSGTYRISTRRNDAESFALALHKHKIGQIDFINRKRSL